MTYSKRSRSGFASKGGYGANDPNRTDDLLITSELLYQLSYVGLVRMARNLNTMPGGVKAYRKAAGQRGSGMSLSAMMRVCHKWRSSVGRRHR